jgi:riboflavin biosynthesis pyrimidine reductase
LKGAAERDLVVGGPILAADAFRTGLVDECHVFLAPVLVGGGTRALPEGMHRSLELFDECRFPTGFAYLGHRVAGWRIVPTA